MPASGLTWLAEMPASGQTWLAEMPASGQTWLRGKQQLPIQKVLERI